jgi:hypothetical protein
MRSTFMPSRRSRRVALALVVAAVAAATGAAAVTQPADATVTTLKKFTTPGTYTWTVPTGVTNVTFDVYGARGGGVVEVLPGPTIEQVSSGGTGGEAKGKFTVHAGEVFEIVVGGQGVGATLGGSSGGGGFNGGGPSAAQLGDMYTAGGGGGSDVRIGGRGNSCASSKSCSLDDRLIVGGGGGGGGNFAGSDGRAGGGVAGAGSNCAVADGGRQQSGAQECGGHAGSASCLSDTNPGRFGIGGTGCENGGGGGGGWWGGSGLDGGGGSGYISALSLSGSFPGGTNAGNGKVIITTTT